MSLDAVTMEWLMEDKIDSRAGLSLAKMTVALGITSELHHHTNCSETLYLVEGTTEQRVGDDWIKMKAGQTCLIPVGAKHQTRNTGNSRAVMMLAYSAGTRIYVTDAH